MKTKGNTRETYASAFKRLGSYSAVAAEFGVNESTVRVSLKRGAALSSAGYAIRNEERTGEQAWADHQSAFERRIGGVLAPENAIRRAGPFVLSLIHI